MTVAIILSATAVAITFMLCFACLRGWRGWLELKRLELDRVQQVDAQPETDVGVRIELAAVRERLKKLEAIASGVEL